MSTNQETIENSTTETINVNPDSALDAAISITGGFLSSILVIVVISVVVSKLLKKPFGNKTSNNVTSLTENMPDEMQLSVKNLDKVRLQHIAINSTETAASVALIMKNTAELVRRAQKSGSLSQQSLIEVKYSDIFDKLSKLLGEEYYLDVYKNPNMWSRPESRMSEVLSKLSSVNEQVLSNIRQLNDSQDLDFKVALESLLDNTGHVETVFKTEPDYDFVEVAQEDLRSAPKYDNL